MPGTVLTYSIRADASQATGELKRVGTSFDDLGQKASSAGKHAEVSEKNFLSVAKRLGVDLSGAAERTVAKLEGLQQHLIKTGAPAADLERVSAKLAEAQNRHSESLRGGTTAASSFGDSLGSVRNVAAAMGVTFGALAIANMIREWVGAASDFQRQFANVTTLFDTTKVDAGALRAEILNLSGSLGSAAELTRGVYEAISAGVEPANAVRFVGEAAMFAKAALTDTRTAVDVLTTTINAYGMAASDAGRISDIMFTTIKLGKITGQELSASLGQVIGVAATTGVKFEELNAAIASLTAGGVKGSEAITALKAIISNIGKPTKDASDAAAKLGIDFNLAALKSQGLAGFLGELTEKARGNTQAQKDLFGSIEAFNSIAILTSDQGAKRFNDAMIQIQNSVGETTRAFEKQNSTVGAQSEALWNNLTRLFIKAAGDAGSLTETLKGLNRVLESNTWGDAYLNFTRLTIQWGLMGKAAKQALVDGENHRVMMDGIERSTKRNQDAMHGYSMALLNAGKAQEKAVVAKTAEELEKQAKAAEKVHKELDKLEKQYASITSKILIEIKAIQEDISFMGKHHASLSAVTEAKERLGQKTQELIAIQAKHPEIINKNTVAFQSSTVSLLGERSAVELLTAAYDRFRNSILEFASVGFDPVISNNATLEAAAKRADEATVAWGKLNDMIAIKTPESLKPASQSFEDLGRQVSTVVTDLGKGIADALIKWEGFGSSMIRIAREFASATLRTVFEGLLSPLQQALSSIFGGSPGKAGLGAGGLAGLISGLPAALTLGGAAFGAQKGGTVGAVAGGLGGFATAGGIAGMASGTGTSFLGGAATVLGSIPVWGWAALAGLAAAGPLIGKFTQRGRDKRTATGGAKDLSSNFWEGTFEDAKAGRITIDDALAELNKSWDNYVKFLNDNLKDQTVIQRSIDSQRITLTEGTAALEKLREQLRIDSSVSALKQLGAQFLETGQMTDAFAKAITDAGGSVDAFTRISGEVQRLQGLRNELGALKQMVDSFLPKQKTWMENFFETGEITEDMARKIREAGGDIEQFKKFADMKSTKAQFESLVAEFNKTGVASEKLMDMILEFGGPDARDSFKKLMDEAQASGKTIGELAKDSEASTKVIQSAFDATGQGINKAFTDAAQNLSDTLAKMDENLGKAIGDLQTAMVTMIQNLINVILGVPGAAEKAARDANFFLSGIRAPEIRINVSTHFDDSGLREAEARARALANIGFNPPTNTFDPSNTNSNTDRSARDAVISDPRTPRFAEGTNYVPRTGLALVHQGEAIIPAGKNFTGGNITLQFTGNIVANNPEELMGEIERYLATNRDGARVRIQKALRLKESGAF